MAGREELVEAVRDYALPALLGSGGLLAWLRSWWRCRQRRKRLDAAQLETTRSSSNAVRYLLYLMAQPDAAVEVDAHKARVWEHLHDVSDAREELWLAMGNESRRDDAAGG